MGTVISGASVPLNRSVRSRIRQAFVHARSLRAHKHTQIPTHAHGFSFQGVLRRRLSSGKGDVLRSFEALEGSSSSYAFVHARLNVRQRRQSYTVYLEKWIKQLIPPPLLYFFWFNETSWFKSRIFVTSSYLDQQFPVLLKGRDRWYEDLTFHCRLLSELWMRRGANRWPPHGAKPLRGPQLYG